VRLALLSFFASSWLVHHDALSYFRQEEARSSTAGDSKSIRHNRANAYRTELEMKNFHFKAVIKHPVYRVYHAVKRWWDSFLTVTYPDYIADIRQYECT
jgi:hypothetical protein